LGLAVPNCGDDHASQNDTIRYLCEVTGRNLQAIMFHTDARLRTPPSINTLVRLHKLCTRARAILAGRQVAPSQLNLEPAHAVPAAEDFLVFPTPYFKVRNPWLKQYAGLVLLALTEAMQHTENARPVEISTAFAGLFGQYVHRVYRLMAVELLRIDPAAAQAADFALTEEQIRAYDPSKWFTSTELIDVVPEVADMPTEDDLQVLTDGIPVSRLPPLSRWPTSQDLEARAAAPVPKEAFAAPPGA